MAGTGSTRKRKSWEDEKVRQMSLSQEEKRNELSRSPVTLEEIRTLLQEYRKNSADDNNQDKNNFCNKVSLYKGDITQLEVDAIVNAANSSLLGGGGVDGCIHRAAGPHLFAECRTLGGCPTGQARITCGYQLPAKYVIHTVGPIARGHLSDSHKEDLRSCYKSSLALVKEFNIRSIAFPCISTGIYGFPNEPAANIALNTAKEWLSENHDSIDRIIFCVFLDIDYKIYKTKLKEYFPKAGLGEKKASARCDSGDIEESAPGESGDIKESAPGESDDVQDSRESDEEETGPDVMCPLTAASNTSAVKEEENRNETDTQEEINAETQSQIMESQDTVPSLSPDPSFDSQEQESNTSDKAGDLSDVEMNSQSTDIGGNNNEVGEMDEENNKK